MSEDADTEILPPETAPDKPQKTVGFKILGVAMLLAAGVGTIGGGILSKSLQKPMPDLAPVTKTIETLNAENKTLKAQITRLQRDLKAIPKPANINLSAIKKRLSALETAEPQVIDPDLVTRLEALQAEGSEALDLSDILARIEVLENRPEVIVPITPQISEPQTRVAAFPEDIVLVVIDRLEGSEGWLKKSLKKHISVQSDDNPRYLLEQITGAIEAGNMEAALTAFDKLPEEAKAAAKEWRESLERQ